jgi:hypothetical protein
MNFRLSLVIYSQYIKITPAFHPASETPQNRDQNLKSQKSSHIAFSRFKHTLSPRS